MVAGDPVKCREEICFGANARVVENLDSNDLSALGNTTLLISAP